MAKVTWLGEDDLHHVRDADGNVTDERAGPSFTIWNGVKFKKGEAVEIVNPKAIEKARGNPFFKVEDAAQIAQRKVRGDDADAGNKD